MRIGRNGATVVPEKHLDIERESQLAITLAQAVCASEKMDWIIQKAVELGVNRIQPLATKLSMIRLSGERAERRMSHWQQVAISACEQCGRNHIPQVLPLEPLHNWLGTQASDRKNSVSPDSRFMLSPVAKNALRDFPRSSADAAITLLIGRRAALHRMRRPPPRWQDLFHCNWGGGYFALKRPHWRQSRQCRRYGAIIDLVNSDRSDTWF